MLRRWAHAQSARGWRSWTAVRVTRIRSLSLVCHAVAHMLRRRLACGLHSWVAASASRAESQRRLRYGARCFHTRGLSRGFVSWADAGRDALARALRMDAVTRIGRTALKRWSKRRLAYGWRGWKRSHLRERGSVALASSVVVSWKDVAAARGMRAKSKESRSLLANSPHLCSMWALSKEPSLSVVVSSLGRVDGPSFMSWRARQVQNPSHVSEA